MFAYIDQLASESVDGYAAALTYDDDQPEDRKVMSQMLESVGFRIREANDGLEAVAGFAAWNPHAVLMDMRMPVMDGVEATRRIRNPQSEVLNHDVPIVAMTANAMESDRQLCLAVGMNDFVAKPISVAVLRDALKKWLPSKNPVSEAVASPPVSYQTAESEVVVFNPTSVLSRLEGDNALAQVVYEAFLEDVPHQIQTLKELVECRDDAGSARQAHSIRGASANVGGERLRQLATEVEKAADAGDWNLVVARMDELERQFGLLEDAIKQDAIKYDLIKQDKSVDTR